MSDPFLDNLPAFVSPDVVPTCAPEGLRPSHAAALNRMFDRTRKTFEELAQAREELIALRRKQLAEQAEQAEKQTAETDRTG